MPCARAQRALVSAGDPRGVIEALLFRRRTDTGTCTHVLEGHEGEISKVQFNPAATKVVTASSDNTARLWDTNTGEELQVRGCPVEESCGTDSRGEGEISGTPGISAFSRESPPLSANGRLFS